MVPKPGRERGQYCWLKNSIVQGATIRPRPLPLSYLGSSMDDLFSLLLYNTFKARDYTELYMCLVT